MNQSRQWMIYGANGYTGKIIAQEAKRRGMFPVLAGRNRESLSAMGRDLGLDVKVFDLEDSKAAFKNISGMSLVLHCAGPFSATAISMLNACMGAKAYYLDITGEIGVFERVRSMADQIAAAGIVAIPGVGFDVVPSDCLAAMLKRDLPDATHLSLGFKVSGNVSPGTLKTAIEGLPAGGLVRENGTLISVPAAHKQLGICFDRTPEPAVSIPWGDLSTAFYSTGIPNIEVFMAMPQNAIRLIRMTAWTKPILRVTFVQGLLKFLVEKKVKGDSESKRQSGWGLFWGRAVNPAGSSVERRLKTPDAYDLTADAALHAVDGVSKGNLRPGFWTPSLAFGPDFVLKLKGVGLN